MKRFAIVLALCLASCNSPTEPSDYRVSCEYDCTETKSVALSDPERDAAIALGRAQVQAMADSGEIRLSRPLQQLADPKVDWRPCPWMCSGCYDTPGGASQNICAAGSTSEDGKTIRVSTWDRARRSSLVTWEARNSFWIRTGNGRLAHAASPTYAVE